MRIFLYISKKSRTFAGQNNGNVRFKVLFTITNPLVYNHQSI